MNTRLTEIYRSCRSREGLASQDEYKSANVLLGTEVEKFAELIVRECMDQVAEFNRLTKAHQEQGIDPEIDVTKEVLKNFGFTRFPRS